MTILIVPTRSKPLLETIPQVLTIIGENILHEIVYTNKKKKTHTSSLFTHSPHGAESNDEKKVKKGDKYRKVI